MAKTTTSIAKKAYGCDLCSDKIKKGEKYTRINSEYSDWFDWENDGSSPFQSFKRHTDCDKAYNLIVDSVDDMDELASFYQGGTRDALSETFGNLDKRQVMEGIPKSKRKFVEAFIKKAELEFGYSPEDDELSDTKK